VGFQAFDERQLLDLHFVADDGTPTGIHNLVFAPNLGARVDSLMVSSTDTIAHTIVLDTSYGGTVIQLGSLSIPAGSGFNGVPPVDLLTPFVLPALGCILLPATAGIHIELLVAVSATKNLYFFGQCGAF
jgi:hypothetical protein